MKFRKYWQLLLLLIGVLTMASQGRENESSIAPSATSPQLTVMTMTLSPSLSPSSLSPTENTKDGDLGNKDVITRPREFKGRFTITNISWKSQYANVKSTEYNSLKSSLETVLNNGLENKISGFIMCVVQWFNKGSVITDFTIFVKGNTELTNERLQRIISEVSSSGSLANFSLGNIVMESQPTQEPEESEASLMIELWKIISLGGLLIVFVLLVFILGLLLRNRLLKKALTRERRNTEERHQRLQLQRRQVETREALSIIAASSTDELSTFLHNENGVQGQRFQSRSFSMGTSRSVERLVDLLRNSEQLAAQRHHRSTDTLGDYDETQFQPSRSKQAQEVYTANKNQEIEDEKLNDKTMKSELYSGSVAASSTSSRSTHEDNLNSPSSKDQIIVPRNDLHSKPKVSFAGPSQENTLLPAREEKRKDQLPKDKYDEEIASRDKPENQANETNSKTIIRSQVQAFEKGTDTNDEERGKDQKRQETKKEPKKLKHISFHNPSLAQPDTLAERRKREEEIRPLGGVVRRFTVNPFRQPSLDKSGDEQ